MLGRKKIYFTSILIVLIIFMLWQLFPYKVSEPEYFLIKKENNIEIRQYSNILVAQVKVMGDRSAAIDTGFRILEDFILGNNDENQKIVMAIPVLLVSSHTQTIESLNKKDMFNIWNIRFVMPLGFTRNNIPTPTNPAIIVLNIPAKKYIVIKFSGPSSQANLSEHEKILKKYIANEKLIAVGEPIYAFYSPSWILPFFRRNEIMFKLSEFNNSNIANYILASQVFHDDDY